MQSIRYKKLVGVYYPTTQKKESRGLIIIALGAPNIEDIESLRNADILTDSGYDVFVPEYYGFCRSGGRFSPKSSLKSLIDAYKIFSKGITCYDIYSALPFQKKYTNIIFLGFSYGGGLVLKLPRYCPDVRVIGAFYPVIEYAGLREEYQEESGEDFLCLLRREFRHIYRLTNLSDWRRFFKKYVWLSPRHKEDMEYMRIRDIFLAHGTSDTSIHYTKTKRYYKELKKRGIGIYQCNIYPGLGHGYETLIPASYDFVRWIDSISIAK